MQEPPRRHTKFRAARQGAGRRPLTRPEKGTLAAAVRHQMSGRVGDTPTGKALTMLVAFANGPKTHHRGESRVGRCGIDIRPLPRSTPNGGGHAM
jgi:hypothetical protein